jgi:8-oxo-dGTP pyrophosphatase MutT (NUDIX family)
MANNKDLSVMINDVKLNVRVGAIIKHQNKILVERNKNVDFSVVPGGRVQTLETSLEALLREINEELGIDLTNEKFELASLIENYFTLEEKNFHELYFVYKVELKQDYNLNNGFKNLDNSNSSYYFLTPEELEKEKILPEIIKQIDKEKEFKHYIINDIKQ